MISMTHPGRLVAMLASVVCAASSYGATRPNIVLIMADDLGYETLGSYGSASFDTPHLDRWPSKAFGLPEPTRNRSVRPRA